MYLDDALRRLYLFSRVFSAPRPRPDRALLQVHLLELPQPVRPTGATVNDVVAAALLSAVAEVLPERFRNRWRQRISLLHMIDLRPYGGELLRRVWGSFLAVGILYLPEPRPASWEGLIESLHRQSQRIREGHLFFGGLTAIALLRMISQYLPRSRRWSLPYALTPFGAALTNTRFRNEWGSEAMVRNFGRSWRIAPLGGLLPLSADLCTKQAQVSLALTCEDSGLISERIDKLKDALQRSLRQDYRSPTPTPGKSKPAGLDISSCDSP